MEQLSGDYCISCDRDEPVPPEGAYIYCLECGHVFKAGQELVEAYNREISKMLASPMYDGWPEATYIDSADKVPFCPLCLHDF